MFLQFVRVLRLSSLPDRTGRCAFKSSFVVANPAALGIAQTSAPSALGYSSSESSALTLATNALGFSSDIGLEIDCCL